MDKNIEDALKYAQSTSKIENMKPTSEELKMIKKILEQPTKEESFLRNVVEKVKEVQKNGKL